MSRTQFVIEDMRDLEAYSEKDLEVGDIFKSINWSVWYICVREGTVDDAIQLSNTECREKLIHRYVCGEERQNLLVAKKVELKIAY